MFDEVANNISMTEDGNFEFYINHNSSFVISNKKVDKKYILCIINDDLLNLSNYVVKVP